MRRKSFLLAHRVRKVRNRPFSLLKMLTRERKSISCVVKQNFLLTIRLCFLSRDTRLTGLSFFSSKCSKTTINHLSYFLNQSRAVIKKKIFSQIFALFLLTARRVKGKLKDKIFHFEKKKVVYLDWTALCKRARYKTEIRKRDGICRRILWYPDPGSSKGLRSSFSWPCFNQWRSSSFIF